MKPFPLFITLLFLSLSTHAQPPEDFCERVTEMATALTDSAAGLDVMGSFDNIHDDYDIYLSYLEFCDGVSDAYYYTLQEDSIPLGFDQHLSGFTTASDAKKVYEQFLEAIEKCFGGKLKDEVNPAPEAEYPIRMAQGRLTKGLLIEIYIFNEYEAGSEHSKAGMDHYVSISMSIEE